MRLRTDLIERVIPGIYLAVAVLIAVLFGMATFLYFAGKIPLALGVATVTGICALAAFTALGSWEAWRNRDVRH